MNKFIIIYVTFKNIEDAEKLGYHIVKERLAACVNIIPSVKSIYWWKNEICNEAETLAIFKTSADNFELFKKEIQSNHSYEVPEIVAVEIVKGSDEYLSWLNEEIK